MPAAKPEKSSVGLANEEDPATDRAEARKVASHTLDGAIKKYLEAKKGELRALDP